MSLKKEWEEKKKEDEIRDKKSKECHHCKLGYCHIHDETGGFG